MCTVTWLVSGGGYELFMNRDELYSRGPGLPPSLHSHEGIRYLAPIDSDGGGTWIAANEFGLTVCLLNHYPPAPPSPPAPPRPAGGYRSRGQLVAELASKASPDSVVAAVRGGGLDAYRPFSLFTIATGRAPVLLRWNGHGELEQIDPPTPPVASSSFDSEAVVASRTRTYAALVGDNPSPVNLAAYHASHEPGKGPYSVCVHREDGGSRSLTRVVVAGPEVRLSYQAGPPCEGGQVSTVALLMSANERPGS
ncbi:MAG TPA: NRDE family protein [Spirochaetia bacterium]|nr:NRDE family protein [Spirochaetia bacterium]